MITYIIEAIVVADLLFNFFFHLLQFRRYWETKNAVRELGDSFSGLQSKLSVLERSETSLRLSGVKTSGAEEVQIDSSNSTSTVNE